MLAILIRTVVLYLVVIISLRLMGKKQLGELQPSELVTTILISNIVTIAIEDLTISMLSGIIPVIMIVCLDIITSKVSLKFDKARTAITGTPQVIISGGIINQPLLKELRYTIDDVLESMRDCNIFDLAQVQYAIVETTGKINFLPADMQPAEDPPTVIIKDGVLNQKDLEGAGLDEKWLRQILFDNKVSRENIFLLTAKNDKDYYIVKKENKNDKRKNKK